jgi:hypothetical protein
VRGFLGAFGSLGVFAFGSTSAGADPSAFPGVKAFLHFWVTRLRRAFFAASETFLPSLFRNCLQYDQPRC